MDGDIKEHTHTKSKLFLYTTYIASIEEEKDLEEFVNPESNPERKRTIDYSGS